MTHVEHPQTAQTSQTGETSSSNPLRGLSIEEIHHRALQTGDADLLERVEESYRLRGYCS